MNVEKYQFESDTKLLFFEFISIGPKGKILKFVEYAESEVKNYFNLGFGDKDEITGEINDAVITNNGDSEKVLLTVILTIYVFIEKHPDAWIQIKGSDKARTRLYRIGITNNLARIEKDFYVFGLKENTWLQFEKGIDYDAFLIKKK